MARGEINKNAFTVLEYPTQRFSSCYGLVTYEEWCKRESEEQIGNGLMLEIERVGNQIRLVRR